METIRQRIARLHAAEEAVALRRHLHQYPDLSEQETPTMNLLCEKLDALGIPYEKMWRKRESSRSFAARLRAR